MLHVVKRIFKKSEGIKSSSSHSHRRHKTLDASIVPRHIRESPYFVTTNRYDLKETLKSGECVLRPTSLGEIDVFIFTLNWKGTFTNRKVEYVAGNQYRSKGKVFYADDAHELVSKFYAMYTGQPLPPLKGKSSLVPNEVESSPHFQPHLPTMLEGRIPVGAHGFCHPAEAKAGQFGFFYQGEERLLAFLVKKIDEQLYTINGNKTVRAQDLEHLDLVLRELAEQQLKPSLPDEILASPRYKSGDAERIDHAIRRGEYILRLPNSKRSRGTEPPNLFVLAFRRNRHVHKYKMVWLGNGQYQKLGDPGVIFVKDLDELAQKLGLHRR